MRSVLRPCSEQNAPILATLVLLAEPPLVEAIVMVKGLFVPFCNGFIIYSLNRVKEY